MGRGGEWEGGSSGDVGSWEEKEKTAVAARAAMAMQGGGCRPGNEEFEDKTGNWSVVASEGVDRISPKSDSEEDWSTLSVGRRSHITYESPADHYS